MKRLKWFDFCFLILSVELQFCLCFSSIGNQNIGKSFHDKITLNPSYQSIYSADMNFNEDEFKRNQIYGLKRKLISDSILKSDQKLIKHQSPIRRYPSAGYNQNNYLNSLSYRNSINQAYSTDHNSYYHNNHNNHHHHLISYHPSASQHHYSKVHYTDNPYVYNSPNYKPKAHQPYKPVYVTHPKKVNPLLILSQDIERISETVLFASMPRPIRKRIIRIIDGHLGYLKGSKNTQYAASNEKLYGGILVKAGKPIEHG